MCELSELYNGRVYATIWFLSRPFQNQIKKMVLESGHLKTREGHKEGQHVILVEDHHIAILGIVCKPVTNAGKDCAVLRDPMVQNF